MTKKISRARISGKLITAKQKKLTKKINQRRKSIQSSLARLDTMEKNLRRRK